MYKLILGIAAGLLLFSSPTMAACTVPNTLTNGTTADATLAMGNFTSLAACAAPLASPGFTGNVGIGDLSADVPLSIGNHGGTAPTSTKLWIAGSGSGPSYTTIQSRISIGGDTNHDYGAYMAEINGDGGANQIGQFGTRVGGTDFPALNLNQGKVGIGTTSPSYLLHVNGTAYATGAEGALSDIRHKMNISPLRAGALDDVMRLQPVTFHWRDPKDAGMQGRQMGFIAQDVEKILPSVVLTEANVEKTKGLKYNELITLLTKAIQEQQAEIATLRTGQARQVRALEAANDNQLREMAALRAKFDSLERSVRVRSAAR